MSTFQDHLRQAAAARAAVQAKAESIVPANARAACIANEVVHENEDAGIRTTALVHYIVSPGFPYDNGKWRVATIDRWGPWGHESSNSAGKPFMTIYEALVDTLYSHPKAVIAEFIDAQGQRHTLIPEFACDAQGRSTLGDYLDQYSPVKQPRPCEEEYRRLNIEPYSFSALAAEKYLWLEQHHSPGIPVPTPDMAQSMIATALLEAAGGTIAGLHAEADEMRRTCGIRHTPEGLPFGYEALLGAADYLQQTRPGLGFFPILPVILTAAGAAAAYGVTQTKAFAESLMSGTERTLDQQVEKFNVRFKSVLRNSHLAQQILDTMMLTDWGAGGCWMLAEALVGWINEKEDEAELWVVNSKECLTEHLVAKNKRLGLFFDYDGAQTKEQVLTSMRKESQHEGLDLVPFDLKQYEDPLVYGISYDEEAVSILLGVFQKHLGSFEDWFPRRAV